MISLLDCEAALLSYCGAWVLFSELSLYCLESSSLRGCEVSHVALALSSCVSVFGGAHSSSVWWSVLLLWCNYLEVNLCAPFSLKLPAVLLGEVTSLLSNPWSSCWYHLMVHCELVCWMTSWMNSNLLQLWQWCFFCDYFLFEWILWDVVIIAWLLTDSQTLTATFCIAIARMLVFVLVCVLVVWCLICCAFCSLS